MIRNIENIIIIFPVFSNSRRGRGRPGRQRTSYENGILHTLDAENNLNQDAITSLAAGRCSWRLFEVACSTADY